jgi:hypothetical protein
MEHSGPVQPSNWIALLFAFSIFLIDALMQFVVFIHSPNTRNVTVDLGIISLEETLMTDVWTRQIA